MAILKDALALVLHRPARTVRTGIGRVLWWFVEPHHQRSHLNESKAAAKLEMARRLGRRRMLADEVDPGVVGEVGMRVTQPVLVSGSSAIRPTARTNAPAPPSSGGHPMQGLR